MEDLTSGNPEPVETGNANESASATATVNGTDNNESGEARQGATAQESFIPQGVDLNTLPPSVRAVVDKINKDMVRGFTEKTTKLSETIKSESAKAAEAYKSKAEQYDQIAQQEEFVKRWNAYVEETQSKPAGAEAAGDPVLNQMKQEIQEMKQKVQLSEMSQVTESFAEAVNEKGEKLHPDFDELNDLVVGTVQNGKGTEEFSLLRAAIELSQGNSPQERLANGYKAAKQLRDKIFEAGKKAGMGRLQAKVLNSSLPPSSSSGDVLSVTDKRPKTAHEALAMAKRGQVVSRE